MSREEIEAALHEMLRKTAGVQSVTLDGDHKSSEIVVIADDGHVFVVTVKEQFADD